MEERRKQQENRKFSKALKSHKAKEKTEDKKRTLDAVKQWKKDKAHRYVQREGVERGSEERERQMQSKTKGRSASGSGQLGQKYARKGMQNVSIKIEILTLSPCLHTYHRGGTTGPLQDDDGLDDVLAGRSPGGRFGARGSGRGGAGGRGGGADGSRRMSKDKKYGFGGPKRHAKATDSKSLNDFSAFNPKKGKSFGPKGGGGGARGGKTGGGGRGGGGGAKKGGNRPGKTSRAKARTKR